MFYRLFNILYKLTSRRGLKVFALTCVILFIISFIIGVNQSHAMSTEDLQTYGSTLIYWSTAYNNNNGNYLTFEHDNTTQSATSNLFKLKYYNGSDRDQNVLIKLSPGYIYAIHDVNPNSASNYAYGGYYFFLDSIENLPMSSSDSPIDAYGRQITLTKTSYTYIMGADKWLLFIPNISSVNCLPEVLQSKYPVMQTGGSSGGGGSSIDYSSYLQDTLQELQDLNTTATLIANDTADINTNVASILSLLQSSSSSDVTTAINNQTTQQQNNYNSFTNTSNYDNSVVNIDSSDFAVSDSQGVDNFTTAVINKVYNKFYDLNMADSVDITIPLPFTNKSFVISTASIQNFYANFPLLANVITAFWYFVFGKYIYNMVMIIYVWLSNGKALTNTNQLASMIFHNNFVINELMM